MTGFENTAIAFALKTNRELNKTWWLFKFLSYPGLVKMANACMHAAINLHLPVKPIIKKTIYRQFVGGETLDDCNETVDRLAHYNVKSILDYSCESSESEKQIDHAFAEIMKSIDKAAQNHDLAFVVFKPTALIHPQLLEKISDNNIRHEADLADFQKYEIRLESICEKAYNNKISLLIDAEDFCFQNAVDSSILAMMRKFNSKTAIVFNTLQMYRHDRLDYLNELIKTASEEKFIAGIKLVRGAYMEKERERAQLKAYPSPIYPDKNATDHAFDKAVQICMENIDNLSLFCGTHNETSVQKLTHLMGFYNIQNSNPKIWFSQLFGMSDHLSFNLAHQGYNVAKYIPYGPVEKVVPYLSRRATENTSVKGQTGRELRLISLERKRRKTIGL